ncbi:MAG: pirin family protein [Planctomycetota bacterium]
MIAIRRSEDRGYADHGWLKSYHTFSFAGYRDPNHMGFRNLRVMNEDRVAPAQGFGPHAHDNMEIVSYVLAGELEHKDSMGNGEVLTPGEFQRISAGTGITHSEFNPSTDHPVHFYQIWLIPNVLDTQPSYEQKRFPDEELSGQLRLVASPSGDDGSITIRTDAKVYLGKLKSGESVEHLIDPSRHLWLQVLRGDVQVNESELSASDAVAVSNESSVSISATSNAELMLFDLS